MGTLWQDVRYGFRMLVKKPGFTAVIVLTLALGIGANTTIFSFLDRVVLRPLAVKKPRELVKLEYQYQHSNHSGVGKDNTFTYPLYVSYRDQSGVFSGLIAYMPINMSDLSNVRVGESVERVASLAVSSNYFSVLGVKPVIGRFFLPEEERGHGAQSVAVISHGLWRRLFEGDLTALGKTISISNHIFTVVGVTPPEFTGTVAGINPGVYVTLGTLRQIDNFTWDNPGNFSLYVLGRLKPGLSRAQAEAKLLVLTEQIKQVISDRAAYTNFLVMDGSRGTNPIADEDYFWLVIALIQAPPMLILIVACANVANMLLARGIMRQREIAIRRAMGANRGDVIRQLLVESSLLALLSGACGALIAHWLALMIRTLFPFIQQSGIPVGTDGRILCLTLLGSLGSVFLFGLAPALRVSRPNVMTVLKDGAGEVTLFARRFSLRNVLVVIQVAVSVIVLSFGVLCLLSLRALRVADPGYDSQRVLAVSVNLKDDSPVNIDISQLFTHLQERVTSLPGVQVTSLVKNIPLSMAGLGHNRTGASHVEDYQIPVDKKGISWDFMMVGPGYFKTLGVPFLRGRDFTPQDGPVAPMVMIVNELMAQQFWPGQDPIGKHVTLGMGEVREVVGVVKAVKLRTIREKPEPLSFWPIAQPMTLNGKSFPSDNKLCMIIRTQSDHQPLVSFLQKELESAGLTSSTYEVGTIAEWADKSLNIQRAVTGLLSAIGAVGLLFVATGIAGLMAYEVSQRTREIGIRMALGAQLKDVLQFVLRKGAILTGVGLVLGLGLSCIPLWILTRLVPVFSYIDEYCLYGVHIWDPLTYFCVILLISLVMFAACYLPARRAAKIDPMEALRYE
jgi:predicted permease